MSIYLGMIDNYFIPFIVCKLARYSPEDECVRETPSQKRIFNPAGCLFSLGFFVVLLFFLRRVKKARFLFRAIDCKYLTSRLYIIERSPLKNAPPFDHYSKRERAAYRHTRPPNSARLHLSSLLRPSRSGVILSRHISSLRRTGNTSYKG